MTDRVRPTADPSLACPFVAFDDDRDMRSSVPDHRHRCFAELRPAPRALAHQEAYCLSAGFAQCPTFVDWAQREAARVQPGAPTPDRRERAGAGGGVSAGGEAPADAGFGSAAGLGTAGLAAAGFGGADRDADQDEGHAAPGHEPAEPDADDDVWPRRRGRDWAAPPPWASDRPAAEPAEDVSPPSFLAGRDAEEIADEREDDHDRPTAHEAEPTRDREPGGGRRVVASGAASLWAPDRPESDQLGGHDFEDDEDEVVEEERAMRRFGPAAGRTRPPAPGRQGRGRGALDPAAPSWERPRRYEAYPTLRTRAGLPRLPSVVWAVIVVAIGAVALFFGPSLLLGIGGGASATPTPSASIPANPSVEPSPSPAAATPVVYIVKSGDTMSKIAASHGVTLDDLIAANRDTVPDPNKLQVGQQLVIPTPAPSVIPGESIQASPSPSG